MLTFFPLATLINFKAFSSTFLSRTYISGMKCLNRIISFCTHSFPPSKLPYISELWVYPTVHSLDRINMQALQQYLAFIFTSRLLLLVLYMVIFPLIFNRCWTYVQTFVKSYWDIKNSVQNTHIWFFKDGNLIIDVDDMYLHVTDCLEYCMEREQTTSLQSSCRK